MPFQETPEELKADLARTLMRTHNLHHDDAMSCIESVAAFHRRVWDYTTGLLTSPVKPEREVAYATLKRMVDEVMDSTPISLLQPTMTGVKSALESVWAFNGMKGVL